MNEKMKNIIGNHFDYNDEELSLFLENERNQDVMAKAGELLKKTIVIEVVDSHGCNTQHKVGDRFYFDGGGNLLTKLSPKKICIYALSVCDKLIFAANELLYAGIDPNEMRFKRAGCFDVGVKCGGWGKCVMEIKVVDRNEIETQK